MELKTKNDPGDMDRFKPEEEAPITGPKPKDTKGKWQPSLVDTSLEEEVARVRAFGVAKYGNPDGWRMTSDLEYVEAAIRHCKKLLKAFQDHDINLLYDEESGLSHMGHAACDLMFVLTRLKKAEKGGPEAMHKYIGRTRA